MRREYEVVEHLGFEGLHVLLVSMDTRLPHLHRELELGWILQGSVELHTRLGSRLLQRGDLYLAGPMEVHSFGGQGGLILSCQISPKLFGTFVPGWERAFPPAAGPINDGGPRCTLTQYCMLRLALAYFDRAADRGLCCFHLTTELLYHVSRLVASEEMAAAEPVRRAKLERLISVLDRIDENYTQKLLLGDIAAAENVSMPYLSHAFKEAFGMSFQEYLCRRRFEHACRLIAQTDRSVLDIALSSGFSDAKYLNRAFRRRYGCTPKEFRGMGPAGQTGAVRPTVDAQYLFPRQQALQALRPLLAEFEPRRAELGMLALD